MNPSTGDDKVMTAGKSDRVGGKNRFFDHAGLCKIKRHFERIPHLLFCYLHAEVLASYELQQQGRIE